MKKIISLAILLAIITTSFSGCMFSKNNVTGTEAAKILLANERLDEKTVGAKIGIFSDILKLSAAGDAVMTLLNAPGVEIGSNYAEWSEFKNYSDLKDNYTQFIEPIDRQASDVATLIVEIKQNVGITDKWINNLSFGEAVMLRVDENSETVIVKDNDSFQVNRRYTDETARNIYEMLSCYDYGNVYAMCIPGVRYEYMYDSFEGASDYFIADKSKGYWEINRFSPYVDENTAVNFDMVMVKDGIAFGSIVDIAHDREGTATMVDLSIPDEERDLLRVMTYGDGMYTFEVFMSNITDGIDAIRAEGSAFNGLLVEEYGMSGTVYLTQDLGEGLEVKLENGKTFKYGDGDDEVKYIGSNVSYSPEYNGDCYIGRVKFEVRADDIETAYDKLENFLNINGIKLYADKHDVLESYGHGELLAENFGDVAEWNGYQLDSINNLERATEVFLEKIEAERGLFEEVKDYDSAHGTYYVDKNLDFVDAAVTGGEASYSDGVITVEELTVSALGTPILENGKEYVIKVGLALRDSQGNLNSVNTVSLKTDSEQSFTYGGEEEFVLMASADYNVPLNFSEGEYTVVAYIVTADEGIRVTEMLPIAFYSANEGELDSVFMDVSTEFSGENLLVSYEVKHNVWIENENTKSEYSYEDIKMTLIRGALIEGYPLTDAPVQTKDGEDIPCDGTYKDGVYRIKFMISTHGELAEAYIYCEFG